MENGMNGRRKKRELRSLPGEHWVQCEYCKDHFHHNGIGMHRHYCALRDPDERVEYQNLKHTLRVPRQNVITETLPVEVTFYTDRDRERLHIKFAVKDSDAAMLRLGRKAEDMGLIQLPKLEDD